MYEKDLLVLLNTEDDSIVVLLNVSNCQSTRHNITEGLISPFVCMRLTTTKRATLQHSFVLTFISLRY